MDNIEQILRQHAERSNAKRKMNQKLAGLGQVRAISGMAMAIVAAAAGVACVDFDRSLQPIHNAIPAGLEAAGFGNQNNAPVRTNEGGPDTNTTDQTVQRSAPVVIAVGA